MSQCNVCVIYDHSNCHLIRATPRWISIHAHLFYICCGCPCSLFLFFDLNNFFSIILKYFHFILLECREFPAKYLEVLLYSIVIMWFRGHIISCSRLKPTISNNNKNFMARNSLAHTHINTQRFQTNMFGCVFFVCFMLPLLSLLLFHALLYR